MYEFIRERSEVITSELQLARLAKKMRKIQEFAYDTEANGLRCLGNNSEFKVVGISISWGKFNNYYIPLGHVFDEDQLSIPVVVKYLKPIFERTDVRIIGWNLKFDLHVLARIGILVKTKDLFDGMIASWLCDENTPNGLKENTEEILGIVQGHFKDTVASVTKEEKKWAGLKSNSTATFDLVRIEVGAPYALDDAYYTWELYLYFLDKIVEEEMDKIYWNVYTKFIVTLFKMEERGVTVDLEKLERMKISMEADLESLLYELYEMAGIEFNPASSQQLAELLFGFNGLEHFKYNKRTGKDEPIYKNPNDHILAVSFGFPCESTTDSGAPQSSTAVLKSLAGMSYKNSRKQEGVHLVAKLLEYKKLLKLKTAFVDGILENMYEDGKIHSSCNIIGTTSGRISMSNVNLQQLPKSLEDDDSGFYELVKQYKIRDIFIGSIDPKTGKRKKIIAIDYDNLEMRVLAHFSLDELLIKMFENGDDSHGSTAVNMFDLDCHPNECKKKYHVLRQVGKVLNFLLVYGGGAQALYEMLKSYGVDLSEKKYLDEYKVRKGVDVAQIYIDKYFTTYKGVSNFLKGQKKFAHRNGFVYTVVGRKRRLHNINSSDFRMASYEERLALNQPIQGTAGDITMNAQNRIDADEFLIKCGCLMLIQVHDELVFECPEEYVEVCIPVIKHYMENPFGDNKPLNLPFTASADFGNSYHEAK